MFSPTNICCSEEDIIIFWVNNVQTRVQCFFLNTYSSLSIVFLVIKYEFLIFSTRLINNHVTFLFFFLPLNFLSLNKCSKAVNYDLKMVIIMIQNIKNSDFSLNSFPILAQISFISVSSLETTK